MEIPLAPGDTLIVVDVQYDFLPGGNLAVPMGDEVIPALNRYLALFHSLLLPVFATRDWHTQDHCSFREQGGPWPPHCVAGTPGAAFSASLGLPADARIISKAMTAEQDAYSGFEGTVLNQMLQSCGTRRLFIGGLATDYCVLSTVKDALHLGYAVFLLEDAVCAVNVHPHDGLRALAEMARLGAVPIRFEELASVEEVAV